MSNIFSGLSSEGIEEAKDVIGGFKIWDTDIYEATIKAFYSMTSSKGAKGTTLILDIDGSEYTTQIWVTDQKGKNYYEKDGKKQFLPGWNHADNIALVATGGKGLAQLDVEDKTFKVWDPNARQALPKSVPTFVETLGKKIWVALVRETVNVNVKQGDDYVPSDKTRDQNEIDKVFDYDTKKTVAEAVNGKEASFFNEWLAANKGKTRDRTTKGATVSAGGTAGRPGTPPVAGASDRPSLFGGKK